MKYEHPWPEDPYSTVSDKHPHLRSSGSETHFLRWLAAMLVAMQAEISRWSLSIHQPLGRRRLRCTDSLGRSYAIG